MVGAMHATVFWLIVAATLAGILLRPKHWPEAVWACTGATLLVLFGLLPAAQAGAAIAKGTDVYLFLTGMMLLAALARRAGVFDWLASHAVKTANRSPRRLFTLVYTVGTMVTVLLSNDATAVVLTPAVYAAVKKAGAKPLPYLLICAFIANAASFVLPISNPANLVVYGRELPALWPWLRTFLLPSVCSIAVTYCILRWWSRRELAGELRDVGTPAVLSRDGRLSAVGIAFSGAILVAASAVGRDLGVPTLLSAFVVVLVVTRAQPNAVASIAAGVSWSVLPLVAGLFVLVEAANHAGALNALGRALQLCARMPDGWGVLAASFGLAGLSNAVNNLPSGLLAGGALQSVSMPPHLRDAVLIGVDLGPNLSVNGSLATVLWLIVLRREGEHISGWQFLKAGVLIMPPTLVLAVLAVSFFPR